MKSKKILTFLSVITVLGFIVSCSGNKKEQTITKDTSEQNEVTNTIADQIEQLESQSNVIVNQMNEIGTAWAMEHPEITDDAVLNDSLNAVTEGLRLHLKDIQHAIDSLKAL